MRAKSTAIDIAIIALIFLGEAALVVREPAWGFRSPFPLTILHSLKMPVLLGLVATVTLAVTKSAAERRLMCWIVAASVCEIVTIKAMLWLDVPALVVLVLLLNAFISCRFLEYGYYHLLANNSEVQPGLRTAKKPGTINDSEALPKAQETKQPATVIGFTLRVGLVAAGSAIVARFLAGPIMFTKVGGIIIAAVVAPGVLFGVIQQVRLRKQLSQREHP